MNLNKIGGWLQVFANIGILAGLILVGLQMKQNSDLLKIQLSYEESSRYIQNERVMWGEQPSEVWQKSIESPEELTLAEQRIMESIVWANVQEWRAAYKLSKQGLLGDEWKDRINNEAAFLLANQYGRAWWKANFADDSSDEFALAVSAALRAKPNRTHVYFNELMDNVRNSAPGDSNQ